MDRPQISFQTICLHAYDVFMRRCGHDDFMPFTELPDAEQTAWEASMRFAGDLFTWDVEESGPPDVQQLAGQYSGNWKPPRYRRKPVKEIIEEESLISI